MNTRQPPERVLIDTLREAGYSEEQIIRIVKTTREAPVSSCCKAPLMFETDGNGYVREVCGRCYATQIMRRHGATY